MIFFDNQELKSVIFVIGGPLHTFEQTWQSRKSCLLLFAEVLVDYGHYEHTSAKVMGSHIHNSFLHFLKNLERLCIV